MAISTSAQALNRLQEEYPDFSAFSTTIVWQVDGWLIRARNIGALCLEDVAWVDISGHVDPKQGLNYFIRH